MLLAWALALIVAAGALALLTALYGSSSGSVYAIAALAVLAVLVERESIRLTPASEASVASLVFIFAGVVFGPLAGLIVGAAGLLSDFRRPYLRWAIWTSSRTLVAGAAAWTAYFFAGDTRNRFSADTRTRRSAFGNCLGPSAHSCDRRPGICVCRCIAVERCAFRASGIRSPTSLRHVPAAAGDIAGACDCQRPP